jgi:hypothetical protein
VIARAAVVALVTLASVGGHFASGLGFDPIIKAGAPGAGVAPWLAVKKPPEIKGTKGMRAAEITERSVSAEALVSALTEMPKISFSLGTRAAITAFHPDAWNIARNSLAKACASSSPCGYMIDTELGDRLAFSSSASRSIFVSSRHASCFLSCSVSRFARAAAALLAAMPACASARPNWASDVARSFADRRPFTKSSRTPESVTLPIVPTNTASAATTKSALETAKSESAVDDEISQINHFTVVIGFVAFSAGLVAVIISFTKVIAAWRVWNASKR